MSTLVIILSIALALTLGVLIGILYDKRRKTGSVIKVLTKPEIIKEPEDQQTLNGTQVTFNVNAKGKELIYQWQRNGADLPGANNPSLKVDYVTQDDNGGRYKVIIRNTGGTTESREAKLNVQVNNLIIGDPLNPALELTRLPSTIRLGPEMPVNERLNSVLAPILQHAPGLALSGAMVAAPNMYIVRYSANVAKGIADGTLTHMPSQGGILSQVTDGKRIAGTGVFDKANGINMAGVALAVWQIMAIVTAQKFLSDINRRLANIERGLQDVKAWLEEEAWSTLNANYRYLFNIVGSLNKMRLSESEVTVFLTQIEQIDRECSQIHELLYRRMHSKFEAFQNQNVVGVGLEENTAALVEFGSEYFNFYSGAISALRVRGAAVQIRLALPVQHELTSRRLEDIGENIIECKKHLESFKACKKTKINHLEGFWSGEGTDKEHRKLVESTLDKPLREVSQNVNELDDGYKQTIKALEEVDNLHKDGIALAIELDSNGQIVRINQITDGKHISKS